MKTGQLPCEKCKLGARPQVPVEVGKSPILWIGEAPGATEVELGRPFCGSSGRFLRAVWGEVFRGTKWEVPTIANAVLCRPPGNRTPRLDEVKLCAQIVDPAILGQGQKWDCVVLLGDTAIKKIFGGRAGWKTLSSLPYRRGDTVFFPMPHPAKVLRQRALVPYFRWLLIRLRGWLERKMEPEPAFHELAVASSAEEAARYLDLALCASKVGLDIETTRGSGDEDVVDPFDPEARVIGLSIAFAMDSRKILAVFLLEELLWDNRVREKLSELFAKRKAVIQNAPFDMAFLEEKCGVKTAPVAWDTKKALWLIHTDAPRKDLAFLQALYTFTAPHKEEFRSGKAVGSLSQDKLVLYNATDAAVLLHIARAQEIYVPKKILPWGQTLVEWMLELQWIATQMKLRGIRVDTDRLKTLEAEILPRLASLDEWFARRGVNPRSPKQLAKFFFEELGLKNAPRKGTSLDKEALARLADYYPDEEAVQKLVEHRELEQLRKAFIKKLPRLLKADGKLHPNWVTDGTATGRWSCKEPNMQQIPKFMRDFVLCTMAGDYDRMELWVLAYDAEDYELAEVLRHSDVHDEVRKEISRALGRPVPRRQAKSVVFGYVYGQTPRGLAQNLRISVAEAEIFQASLEKRFPKLKRWKERRIREATDKGFLETPFGLRRYVEKPTQALNYPIQSTAVCVTLRALQLCWHKGWNVILQVHDQIVLDGPDYVRPEEFERTCRFACPWIGEFPIEVKVGKNWKEVS